VQSGASARGQLGRPTPPMTSFLGVPTRHLRRLPRGAPEKCLTSGDCWLTFLQSPGDADQGPGAIHSAGAEWATQFPALFTQLLNLPPSPAAPGKAAESHARVTHSDATLCSQTAHDLGARPGLGSGRSAPPQLVLPQDRKRKSRAQGRIQSQGPTQIKQLRLSLPSLQVLQLLETRQVLQTLQVLQFLERSQALQLLESYRAPGVTEIRGAQRLLLMQGSEVSRPGFSSGSSFSAPDSGPEFELDAGWADRILGRPRCTSGARGPPFQGRTLGWGQDP